MSFNQQVFTDAGLSMLSAAEGGSTLTITKIVAGNGSAASDADLIPLTALIGYKTDVVITRRTDLGKGKMIVSGQLVEALMPAGSTWSLKELGVMAKIGAGPEQLYTVSNVYADPADTVTPHTGTATHAFDITLNIGRATTIDVTLGDPTTVDVQNIPSDATVGAGVYAGRVGNVFQMKRLVTGEGMQIVEESDRITIGVKTIAADLDLYVPASHPAAPSPDVAFATLQAALDSLSDTIIPPDKVVTIHIYSGTFTASAAIAFNHANSSQIYVVGEARVDKTITAIDYINGTTKRVTVSPDATGLSVGQAVYIANSTAGWAGGCYITAISGNLVTCSILKRDSRPDFTTNDHATGRRLSYYPTVLKINDPSQVLNNIYLPHAIGGLTNLTIIGGSYGIYGRNGDIRPTNIAIFSARAGISCDSLVLNGENVFCDGDAGIVCIGTAQSYDQVYINGCGEAIHAIRGLFGSQTSGQDAYKLVLSHNLYGIILQGAQYFRGGSIQASSSTYGVFCDLNSVAFVNPSTYQSAFDNNATDLLAQNNSYIVMNKFGGASPSCSPAAEVVGSQNSLIHLV